MSDTTQPAQVPGAPSLPQVNLLPPHVRAKRKIAVLRLWLGLALLVVVFLTSLTAVATVWEKQSAASKLVDAQDRNEVLRKDQDQYAAAPKALGQLKTLETARTAAMSTEMLWSPYLSAISAATPLEASIDVVAVSQDTVWTGSQNGGYGPLDTPGTVGVVSLNGRALTLAAVSDWQDSLNGLKGVADVDVSAIQVNEENGTIYYAVTATFKMTPEAFANQYVTEQ